jgi:hypothetical protein
VVAVVVIGGAIVAGQQLTQHRAQQDTDVQAFAPLPAGAAGTAGAPVGAPVRCEGAALNSGGGRYADPAWSPDSNALAASRLSDDGSAPRIALLYGPDWTARDIGVGRVPRWSASGELLAFERTDAPGMLRIVNVRSGTQVATLASTGAYVWQGDILLFWRGPQLRAWSGGADEVRFEIATEYAPARGFEASFSGDGSRFALVRREDGKIAQFLLGETNDGRASPQDAPVSYSWAPVGRRLLLDQADSASLFNEAKQSATIARSALAGTHAGWSPDGLRALFGSASTTALLGWDGKRIDPVASADTTARKALLFARDGRKLATLDASDALAIRECADAGMDPRIKITPDQAIALVRQRPDVLSVGARIEAKLVIWAEVRRNVAPLQSMTNATIEPSTPVWVVAMIGEVKRPPSWNPPGALATYNLGRFVLDATDGHELGVTVTTGTWWIGDGFDDLNEYGALPPATMPPPGAFTKPVAPSDYALTPTATSVRVDSPAGWSLDVPKHWWVSPPYPSFGGAVISNFDPDYGSSTHVMTAANRDRVRLTLQTWSNEQRRSLDAWVDEAFRGSVSQRASTTLGGHPAHVLTQHQNFGPPPNGDQISRVWVVSTGPVTMLVMSALPADSTKLADAERVLQSLRLRSQAAAPSPTITKAEAIRIALEKQTGSATTKPMPMRVDRTEAKLVRSAEAGQITGPFAVPFPAPLTAAPDDPVWVVAIAGDLGMTTPNRCGPIACPPQAIRSSTWFIDAHTGQVRGNPSGPADWPSFFDALPDRS